MTIDEVIKKYHKIEIELLLAHVLKKPNPSTSSGLDL
jgi:hypothetical protein